MKLHVAFGLFGDASLAVQVTVVVPTGKLDPEAGTQFTVTTPGQLSVPVGVVYVTTLAHWPAVFGSVMFAGHVTEGAWVSCTVTVNVHVPAGLSGETSFAVHVTVVVPTGKVDPDAGTQLTVTTPGQLSVPVGVVYVTTAEHWPAAFACVMFAGHVTVGACVSCTVTVNEHDPVFAEASVAVHVTVVAPTGKVAPDAGTQTTVAPGQLSVAVGVVKLTTAEHWPAALPVVMFAGHVTVGACVSVTVTVNEHVPSGLFAETSLAVHVTVVEPTGKVEPDPGTQLTVTTPGQLSVPVGVV